MGVEGREGGREEERHLCVKARWPEGEWWCTGIAQGGRGQEEGCVRGREIVFEGDCL